MFWVATEKSVKDSVKNAMQIVNDKGYKTVAFPLIGFGSGNRGKVWSQDLMLEAFEKVDSDADVRLVVYE